MAMPARFAVERTRFHNRLAKEVIWTRNSCPSIADKGNRASQEIAHHISRNLGLSLSTKEIPAQRAGNKFEEATAAFVDATFSSLGHLRPGGWGTRKIGQSEESAGHSAGAKGRQLEKLIPIAKFEQYRHLVAIAEAAKDNDDLRATLGSDYIIKPDVVVFRELVGDVEINRDGNFVDETVARYASLRKANGGQPLLHASVSCKLTIRSDRSQNSRSEAINLIRNRRGHLPHVVVVTAEPLPSRLSSVALGSDIDCVYHIALPELEEAVETLGLDDSRESLRIMTHGRRLKDISDLPLDLAV